MKRPGFFQGVGVALLAALSGEVLFVALRPLLGSLSALHIVIATASFGYTLYLLRASGERLGRLTTLALWLTITVLTAWMAPPLMLYVVIHVAMIWLVRALYFYSSVLPALADLGLSVVAVAAVVWASVQSGSLMLSLWCFFLVQALFVMIPRNMDKPVKEAFSKNDDDPFEAARRNAHEALRKLSAAH